MFVHMRRSESNVNPRPTAIRNITTLAAKIAHRRNSQGLVGLALAAVKSALEIKGKDVYKKARLAIRVLQGLGEVKR